MDDRDNQMSLFDMLDDNSSMFMSSDDDFITVDEYEERRQQGTLDEPVVDSVSQDDASKDKAEADVVASEKAASVTDKAQEASDTKEDKVDQAINKALSTPVSRAKGINLTIKEAFGPYEAGQSLALISYTTDNEGIIRALFQTQSGRIISLMYPNFEEYKKVWGV